MSKSLIWISLLALVPSFQARAQEKTFTFRIPGEPETLDWNLAHTMIETYILMNLMEGLVTYDSKLKIIPALAESWSVSPDRRTYTFTIRKGIQWSDGIPLTASDFEYSWRRLLAPLTAASYAYLLYDIEGAEEFSKGELKDFAQVGIKAIGDNIFQVKLKRPIAHFLHVPTFWVTFPLRKDIVDQNGAAWSKPGRMVTLGPFTLEARELDSKIVMRANPKYWRSRGNISQATAMIVKDNSTALRLYESKKIDFLTDISTLDLKRLEGRKDLITFPYLKTGYMGFVVTKFPMDLRGLRRAIAMAIDRSQLEKILHGGQKTATSLVPPGMMSHRPKFGLAFNPSGARAELRKSGWDTRHEIKLELLTPNWDKQLLMAQFIQQELKKNLGISISIQPYDHKTFRAHLDLRAYPLFEASWGADFPDPDNFLSIFLGAGGNNRTNWKNSRFDDLVLKARTLGNEKERERLYVEAQKILIEDDAVIVPMYYEPNKALIQPRVRGAVLNPMNYLILREVVVDGGT